jgi:hypothetical protein
VASAVAVVSAPAAQIKAAAPTPAPVVTANQAKVKAEAPAPKTPVAQAKTDTPATAIPVVQAKSTPPIEATAPVKVATPVPAALIAPAIVPASHNVASAQPAPASRHSSNKIEVPAPTMKMARAGNASARVFFGAPADSPNITGYTVTALADGKSTGITATGIKSPITITGLDNGSPYTFTVTAKSGASSSEASEQSNAVTPLKILGD